MIDGLGLGITLNIGQHIVSHKPSVCMICFKQPVIAIHQSDLTNNATVRVRLVKVMVTVANDGVLFSIGVLRTAL